jgi:small subunit ribosomal protein S6
MPLYESTFITRQEVAQHELEKLTDSFIKMIEEGGGKVVKAEQWGLRDFAYPIKKYSKGYYTMLGIDAEHGAIDEIERKSKLNEDILRHITFKVDKIDSEPSQMLKGHDDGFEGFEDRKKEVAESGKK